MIYSDHILHYVRNIALC